MGNTSKLDYDAMPGEGRLANMHHCSFTSQAFCYRQAGRQANDDDDAVTHTPASHENTSLNCSRTIDFDWVFGCIACNFQFFPRALVATEDILADRTSLVIR